MVRHKLTVEEAKALMLNEPRMAEHLQVVGAILITIIAVVILTFIWWVI